MKKGKSISADRSRQIARAKVKELYPDLPRHKVVHHVDGNPFNNEMYNLTVMLNRNHTSLHAAKWWEKEGYKLTTENQLKKLEKWVNLYNERIWIGCKTKPFKPFSNIE